MAHYWLIHASVLVRQTDPSHRSRFHRSWQWQFSLCMCVCFVLLCVFECVCVHHPKYTVTSAAFPKKHRACPIRKKIKITGIFFFLFFFLPKQAQRGNLEIFFFFSLVDGNRQQRVVIQRVNPSSSSSRRHRHLNPDSFQSTG